MNLATFQVVLADGVVAELRVPFPLSPRDAWTLTGAILRIADAKGNARPADGPALLREGA